MLHPHLTSTALLDDLATVSPIDSARWTDALELLLVPDSSIPTVDTLLAVPMLVVAAHTFLQSLVPDLPIVAGREGKTGVPAPVEPIRADTDPVLRVPDHVVLALVGNLTVVSIPLVAGLAGTDFPVLVPHLPVDALNAAGPIIVLAVPAHALGSVPNLPSEAVGVLAELTIPVGAAGAVTAIGHVENLATLADWDLFAGFALFFPEHMLRAFAVVGVYIPDLAACALRHLGAGESVPSKGLGALTLLGVAIEDSPIDTRYANLTIPV